MNAHPWQSIIDDVKLRAPTIDGLLRVLADIEKISGVPIDPQPDKEGES